MNFNDFTLQRNMIFDDSPDLFDTSFGIDLLWVMASISEPFCRPFAGIFFFVKTGNGKDQENHQKSSFSEE